MAPPLNDRQRVELCLPVHMMLSVVIAGTMDPQHAVVEETRNLLTEAAVEPLRDLPQLQQLKLVRRVKRLHRDLLAPYSEEEAKAAQVGLLTFYMLQAMTDSGFLIVGEESSFGKALELMLPAIARKIDADIESRAKHQARDCLRRLQVLGYYDDPAIADSLVEETISAVEQPK